MKPEVAYAATEVWAWVQDRGGSPDQGPWGDHAQASCDLDVPENVLRKWGRDFAVDPAQAFPGHGQMKPEQLEIDKLRREVVKLKAERGSLKWATADFARNVT